MKKLLPSTLKVGNLVYTNPKRVIGIVIEKGSEHVMVRVPEQPVLIKAKELIDDLKGVCANYGLGNDGNEFKIITQVFLYKFLNDKFAYEVKQLEPALANDDN